MLPVELEILIEKFKLNYNAYQSEAEANIRMEFIDKVIKLLGWDVYNDNNNSPRLKEVVLEVKQNSKRPDYCVQISDNERLFYVEAKKPSVKIEKDATSAFQVRSYGWNAQMPLCILTNFEEFVIYNTMYKPNPSDKATVAIEVTFNYEQFSDIYQDGQTYWDWFYNTFSKEAVKKGSLERYKDIKNKKGSLPVDEDFLRAMDKWREALAKDIASNQTLSIEELNYIVQKTIDRIVFLRICEDRGIEYNELESLTKSDNIYKKLVERFKRADDKYNSGLFHFKKEDGEDIDALSLKIKIGDKVLKEIIGSLYPPNSYNFETMPTDILGSVYERFLGKVIRFTSEHRIKVDDKQEIKDAGGVHYTPSYIVKYIVDNTIGIQLKDKTLNNIKKYSIIDPACGSGSFLIVAYQKLLDWYLDRYMENIKKYRDRLVEAEDGYRLTVKERKQILINHIFGVDIDKQAVEVTKLSLLLKAVENINEEISQQTLFDERLLPNLESNIKCGNSLIGKDFIDENLFTDNKIIDKVNPFDWCDGFPEIMKKNGFDCVIGNPPYIFTREQINQSEKQYFYSKYKNTQFKLNTYILFSEKAYDILSERGIFGYIIPTNWMTLENASDFRKFILENTKNIKIISNKDKVFKANVDTMILFFEKNGHSIVSFGTSANKKFNILGNIKNSELLSRHNYILHYSEDKQDDILAKLEQKSLNLEQVAEVKNGVQAYTVGEGNPIQTKEIKENRLYHSFSKNDSSWIKYVDGVDVKRYFLGWSKQYIKYGNNLSRPRKKELFEKERLLVRQIPSKPPYSLFVCYAEDNIINDNNSMIIKPLRNDYDLKFILGVINSRLVSYWFSHKFGKMARKIFPQFKVKELRTFIMPQIDNKAKSNIHDKIVSSVETMLSIQKQFYSAKTDKDKQIYKQKSDVLDKQIDQLVYELYDLTLEEIKLIEEV